MTASWGSFASSFPEEPEKGLLKAYSAYPQQKRESARLVARCSLCSLTEIV